MGGMPRLRGGAGHRIGQQQRVLRCTTTAMKLRGTLEDSETRAVQVGRMASMESGRKHGVLLDRRWWVCVRGENATGGRAITSEERIGAL